MTYEYVRGLGTDELVFTGDPGQTNKGGATDTLNYKIFYNMVSTPTSGSSSGSSSGLARKAPAPGSGGKKGAVVKAPPRATAGPAGKTAPPAQKKTGPRVPAGMVETIPEERARLKKWTCAFYGSGSASCGKPTDPQFTYMAARPLADFRNAGMSQVELGRDTYNPVSRAKQSEGGSISQIRDRFSAWWSRVQRPTWAMWMTTAGFGKAVVPKAPFEWFATQVKGKAATWSPTPAASLIKSLFKVKTTWTSAKLLAEQEQRNKGNAPAPTAGTFNVYIPPMLDNPCPKGSDLAVIAPASDKAALLKQGCAVLSTKVAGAPGDFKFCCPPGYKRETLRPGSTTMDEYTCKAGTEKVYLQSYQPDAPLLAKGCTFAYQEGTGTGLKRYYCCPPEQAPQNGGSGGGGGGGGGGDDGYVDTPLIDDQSQSDGNGEPLPEDYPPPEGEDTFDLEQAGGESFISQHKLLLAVGALAAAGAGVWYYYKKYLPAKEAKELALPKSPEEAATLTPPLTANPKKTEPVYDESGNLLGVMWPAATRGRWVAKAHGRKSLFSTTSPERAAEWIFDTSKRGR